MLLDPNAPHAVFEWNAWERYMLPTVLGSSVRLAHRPLAPAADILAVCPPDLQSFAFHINCSVASRFPPERGALIEALGRRGVQVLNGGITDIRKRSLQRQFQKLGLGSVEASRAGVDDELVIVKTDANYGALGERRLSASERALLGVPAPSEVIGHADDYRVLARGDVPPLWWNDDSLAIERFVDNRTGRYYRVYFAGDAVVVSVRLHPGRIKKYIGTVVRTDRRTYLDELTEGRCRGVGADVGRTIWRAITGLALDFGALDLVEDDAGQSFVVDVNATPFFRPEPALVHHLRSGLFGRPATAPRRLTPRRSAPGDLGVIVAYFDSARARPRLDAFERLTSELEAMGLPWRAAEGSVDDMAFELPPAEGLFRARSAHALWQRERLLNLALRSLPAICTKVVWLDGDVEFENSNWSDATSRRLDQCAIVQPFERVRLLGVGGNHVVVPGFAASLVGDPSLSIHGHPSIAWAARRDLLERHGLYDACVVGGGDHWMTHAFAGDWDGPCAQRLLPEDTPGRAHAVRWAEAVYPCVRARIGFVEGTAVCNWRRPFSEATGPLPFDPERDLVVNSEGLWEWRTCNAAWDLRVQERLVLLRDPADVVP
jgi:hypothetical protein